MKRVVGVILAFLMVFNLVVFTGQVGTFAEGNTPGESTTNGSVTVKILTNFKEIKGITDLEKYRESVEKSATEGTATEGTATEGTVTAGTAKVAMIPVKYDTNDVIMGLPAGSALVTLNGLVGKRQLYNTSTVVTDTNEMEYVSVSEEEKGIGFDGCDEGSIVYILKDKKLY